VGILRAQSLDLAAQPPDFVSQFRRDSIDDFADCRGIRRRLGRRPLRYLSGNEIE
jgi:hypothetical protein